jgi:hypothetical protein
MVHAISPGGMRDAGYKIQDAGYRIQDTGYRITADIGCRI